MVHLYLAGRMPPKKLAQELRAIADWIEPGGKQQPVQAVSVEERELFDYWRRQVGKPSAKFTAERRSKLRARLREGFTGADIRRAIDNVASSGFHRGENEQGLEYCDIMLICRNGSKLEGYRDMAGSGVDPAPKGGGGDVESQINRLSIEATAHLAEGNIDAYNQTQCEIRRLSAIGGADQTGGSARKSAAGRH